MAQGLAQTRFCQAPAWPFHWFVLGHLCVQWLSLKGILMELPGLCPRSGSNSRVLVFGFRMRCVVAKQRLVVSPASWASDFLFPLHQSDPFNNAVPNEEANL